MILLLRRDVVSVGVVLNPNDMDAHRFGERGQSQGIEDQIRRKVLAWHPRLHLIGLGRVHPA